MNRISAFKTIVCNGKKLKSLKMNTLQRCRSQGKIIQLDIDDNGIFSENQAPKKKALFLKKQNYKWIY